MGAVLYCLYRLFFFSPLVFCLDIPGAALLEVLRASLLSFLLFYCHYRLMSLIFNVCCLIQGIPVIYAVGQCFRSLLLPPFHTFVPLRQVAGPLESTNLSRLFFHKPTPSRGGLCPMGQMYIIIDMRRNMDMRETKISFSPIFFFYFQ